MFLNDANYVIMSKVDGTDDKLVKKFTELIANVLDTEVPSSDVKKLDLGLSKAKDTDDEDGEEQTEEPSSDVVLLIKLTTK